MKPTFNPQTKNGFALVVTISMMVLLTMVVVATLSLSTITLRTVDKDSAQAIARTNARLALWLAIGQLQKEAGPDQRVTATAEIEGSKQNPYWMGVWKTGPNESGSKPTWIISGANPDPDRKLDENDSALLASSPSSDPDRPELRAEYVKVKGKNLDGRYAYWVGDEATKARVDVANPEERENDLQFRERVGRSQSPQEPGFAAFDREHRAMWAGFDSDYSGSIDRRVLASMDTVALAAKDSGNLKRKDIPKYYFNDLTTGGFGLPVNVVDGGMKHDLSLILDTSQQQKSFVSNFLGGTPSPQTVAGARIYSFGVGDSKKFGLSRSITESYTKAFVGPNWGTLYNYARMWETVSLNSSPMIGLLPRVDSDLRQTNWLPYQEANKGKEFVQDIQHTNSGLSPVIAMAQIGFLLRSEDSGKVGPAPARLPYYNMVLMMKPIVGLWNPYNVHIQASQYQLEWALAPYLRINASNSDPAVPFVPSPTSPINKSVWLREYWTVGNDPNQNPFPTDAPGNQGGSYIRLKTPAVEFQPGEYRLFSVDGPAELKETNTLVPTLNVDGAYHLPLYIDPKAQTKVRLEYISGTMLTVTTLDLQDTHDHSGIWNETKSKFSGIGRVNTAATWFTLKAGPTIETHLNRYTDLWNGGAGAVDKIIPEPIMTTTTKKQPYSVDSLSPARHLGTWRFYTRNGTELRDADQGLRGWIDSNPRSMSNNFRFDGSKNSTGNYQGWDFSSNFIGAESESGIGDGGGGNRGLVAEGEANAQALIPEGVTTPNRWQGYLGPASTRAGGGLTNVIVYDVPQAPLTSVGQFQHANLSRYNYEPGFVVGNSYANPRVPLGSTMAGNFGGMGFPAVDIAYEVNQRLWDNVFFSTLAPDYKGGGSSFDNAFDYNGLILRKRSLPNPRMVFSPLPGDTSIDEIISDAGADAPQTIATRILIEGAFNVNSTSKTAWKAVLSTMDGSELPVIDPKQKVAASWVKPKGLRFSRFNHPILAAGYTGGGMDPAFWQGWREISDNDLDDLAEAIVEEVKDRGPFRSMAEFVNRNPNGPVAHQSKGALQAALDKVANRAISTDIGKPAGNPKGSNFSGAINGENQAAGHACYLLQGDVLQCLAPIMQVRSDYFRIRTCGEAVDKEGRVVARAMCEAFLQRSPEYVDTADLPGVSFEDLRSEKNKEFGRRFQLVSFRWLNPSEI